MVESGGFSLTNWAKTSQDVSCDALKRAIAEPQGETQQAGSLKQVDDRVLMVWLTGQLKNPDTLAALRADPKGSAKIEQLCKELSAKLTDVPDSEKLAITTIFSTASAPVSSMHANLQEVADTKKALFGLLRGGENSSPHSLAKLITLAQPHLSPREKLELLKALPKLDSIKACANPESRAAFGAICKIAYEAGQLHELFGTKEMQNNRGACLAAQTALKEEMLKTLPETLTVQLPQKEGKASEFLTKLVSRAGVEALQENLGHDKKSTGPEAEARHVAESLLFMLASQSETRVLQIPMSVNSPSTDKVKRLLANEEKITTPLQGNHSEQASLLQHQISVMHGLVTSDTPKSTQLNQLLFVSASFLNRIELHMSNIQSETTAPKVAGTPLDKAPWVNVTADAAHYLLQESQMRKEYIGFTDSYAAGTCLFVSSPSKQLLVKLGDGSVARYPVLGGDKGYVVCNDKVCRSLEEVMKNLSDELAVPCHYALGNEPLHELAPGSYAFSISFKIKLQILNGDTEKVLQLLSSCDSTTAQEALNLAMLHGDETMQQAILVNSRYPLDVLAAILPSNNENALRNALQHDPEKTPEMLLEAFTHQSGAASAASLRFLITNHGDIFQNLSRNDQVEFLSHVFEQMDLSEFKALAKDLLGHDVDGAMFANVVSEAGKSSPLKDLQALQSYKLPLSSEIKEDLVFKAIEQHCLAELIKIAPDIIPQESTQLVSKAISEGSLEDLHSLLEAGMVPTEHDWEAVKTTFEKNVALASSRQDRKFYSMHMELANKKAADHYLALLKHADVVDINWLVEACACSPEICQKQLQSRGDDQEFLQDVLQQASRKYGGNETVFVILEKMVTDGKPLTEATFGQVLDKPEFIEYAVKHNLHDFIQSFVDMLVSKKDELDNPTYARNCILPQLPSPYREQAMVLLQNEEVDVSAKLYLLKSAFKDGNIGAASFFLKTFVQEGILKEEEALEKVEDLLQNAAKFANVDNFQFLDVLLENGLANLDLGGGKTLLHLAVAENNVKVASYLAGKVKSSADSAGETPLALAEKGMRLGMCKAFGGEKAIDNLAEKLLNAPPADLKSELIKAFLNSETNDVLLLMASIERKIGPSALSDAEKQHFEQAISDTRTFMREGGKLIARFPSTDNQTEMHRGYGRRYASYEIQQQEYGQKRFALYAEGKANIGNWSLMQMYQHLSGKKADSIIEGWRMASPYENSLPDRTYDTPIGGRYAFFGAIGEKMKNGPPNEQIQIPQDGGYVIKHQLSNGKDVSLTRVFSGSWYHAHTHTVKETFQECSASFEKIKAFDLKGAKTVPAELKKEIAYFYWLGCHSMPTEKSNSQYMLEIHRMLYEMHGLEIGAPAMEWTLPDCVALTVPFEVFYNEFYDKLFEGSTSS